MLRLIATSKEWDWADSPKLKGALEQSLRSLENGIDGFGLAMTTMDPEYVIQRFPNVQEQQTSFVNKISPLVDNVQDEIKILTNMRLSREK